MYKKIILTLFISLSFTAAFAIEKLTVTPQVYSGIQKYKQGNFAGCLQDMLDSVEKMKDASLPYYYMGNSYANLGRKEDAVAAYTKVVELNTNPGLVQYSKRATECLADATKCSGADELNSFIKSNKFLHPEVVKKIEEQEVEQVRSEMNSGAASKKEIDFNKYKYLNDASDKNTNELADNDIPTNDEIANAVKVLAKIGYNPYAQFANQGVNTDYTQLLSALNQMQDQNNQSDISSVLPYLMAQNAFGNQNNQNQNNALGSQNNAQLIQALMLNQLPQGL